MGIQLPTTQCFFKGKKSNSEINVDERKQIREIFIGYFQLNKALIYEFTNLRKYEDFKESQGEKIKNSRDYLEEFVSRRDNEVYKAQIEEDEAKQKEINEKVVQNFFTTVEFVKNLSNPVAWEDAELGPDGQFFHQVMVVGNLGNGKSTILNKIAHVLKNSYNLQNKDIP